MKRALILAVALSMSAGCFGQALLEKKVLVDSDGMAPAIVKGDYIRVRAGVYIASPIQRFDIVLLVPPQDWDKSLLARQGYWVSRVIGLPGEEVAIRGSKVFINGQPLQEPFEHYPSKNDFAP